MKHKQAKEKHHKKKQDHEMTANVAKCRNYWAEADMSRRSGQ